MIRIKKLITLFSSCLLLMAWFTSCGKDRSGEYYALIATQNWIYETMQEKYLFYEDLPSEDQINFFNRPQKFVASIVSERDQKNGYAFSHADSIFPSQRSLDNPLPSFGIESALIRLPNGAEAVRIIYTQKDSPAEEVNLKRGDWIIAINGKKINSNSYHTYISEPQQACQFTLGSFNGKEIDTLQVVQMPAPRPVAQNNLLKTQLITSGSRKAFYILYNEFGEDEKQLKELFAQMETVHFDDVILDLRYNPGGYVMTSQVLCSNLAPASALGHPFLQMKFNDKINRTDSYNLEPSLLGAASPIQYQNLYVLTTDNTASASEIVINGLRPYLKGNLFQVGTNTYGKNVAQQSFMDSRAPQIQLWLTTAALSNSEDFGDYFTEGLKPDFTIKENLAGPLAPLGDEKDELMGPVLYHMANGSFPAPPPAEKMSRAMKESKVLFNSIEKKPKYCLFNNKAE